MQHLKILAVAMTVVGYITSKRHVLRDYEMQCMKTLGKHVIIVIHSMRFQSTLTKKVNKKKFKTERDHGHTKTESHT